jgi:hypothetical protein
MDTFALLIRNGFLSSRKLDRRTSVMNFRATQLATVNAYGLAPREVEKIKKAYLHAFAKAEREAEKLKQAHRLETQATDVSTRPLRIDKEKVALDAWAEIAHASGDTGSGYIFVWEEQAIRRVAATHIVIEAGILDEATVRASDAIAAADAADREEAERRYDAELERLVAAYQLEETFEEIVAALTTDRIDEAAL